MNTFGDLLKKYMEEAEVGVKDLADASGLSVSTISRYRSGERLPAPDGEELQNLLKALERYYPAERHEELREAFAAVMPADTIRKQAFADRLSYLVKYLSLNQRKLAAYVGYDASFLSRIMSGKRLPSDMDQLSEKTSEFVVKQLKNREVRSRLEDLLECGIPELPNEQEEKELIAEIREWLVKTGDSVPHGTNGTLSDSDSAMGFLQYLDAFDLNDYLKKVHFDKVIVPPAISGRRPARHFYGVEGMRAAELEFCKRVVFGKEKDPVWMFSNFPMEEAAKDENFPKKYMLMLVLMIKKGLTLNILHDLDRPLPEMMMGLQGWIPMYMAGKVSPYYMDEPEKDGWSHLIRISGNCALVGECIGKDLSTAHMYLTSDAEEIRGLSRYRDHFFDRAKPLVEFFQTEEEWKLLDEVRKEESRYEDPVFFDGRESRTFRNISLELYGKRCVIIAKENEPKMYFVFRHPRIVEIIADNTDKM